MCLAWRQLQQTDNHGRQEPHVMSARHTTSTTTLASVASLILIFAPSLSADPNLRREGQEDQVKYGVGHWSESLGLHRAVVRVTRQADALGVHIPWRRRDLEPEKKRILVVDASTGEQLKNVLPVDIQREYGDLVFQPATVPGDYYIYYMPFKVQEGYGGYSGDYLPPESTAEAAWLDRNGLTEERLPQKPWKELPRAELLEIQARTEFDRFDPMEVVATKAEVEKLLAAHPGPFLLFPEDRRYPIRMPDELPLRWIKQGPSHRFEGVAQRNEYYAFQIGLFAARQPLEELAIEFGELRSSTGETISGDRLTCFNLGGSDWLGRPLKKSLSVAQGQVQPLWFGLDIARDVKPGQYEGSLRIGAKNAPQQQVDLVLTISSRWSRTVATVSRGAMGGCGGSIPRSESTTKSPIPIRRWRLTAAQCAVLDGACDLPRRACRKASAAATASCSLPRYRSLSKRIRGRMRRARLTRPSGNSARAGSSANPTAGQAPCRWTAGWPWNSMDI